MQNIYKKNVMIYGLTRAILAICLTFMGLGIIFLIVAFISSADTLLNSPDEFSFEIMIFDMKYIMAAAQLIFMLIPTIYFINKSPLSNKKLYRLGRRFEPRELGLAVVGLVMIIVFGDTLLNLVIYLSPEDIKTYIMDSVQENEDAMLRLIGTGGQWNYILAVTVIALIPAVSEELVFRGLMQRSLEEGFAPKHAILITALIFAASHLTLISFFQLTLIGLYLGYIAWRLTNIVLPIILHMLNNFLAVTIAVYVDADTLSGLESPDLPTIWVLLIASSAGLLFVIRLLNSCCYNRANVDR